MRATPLDIPFLVDDDHFSIMALCIADEDQQQLCAVCLTQFSKYTCPKCNLRYCSLSCYKSEKHGQCSEMFYRDSFMAELQQRHASDAEKTAVVDMLTRLEEEEGMKEVDFTQEEDSLNLEERLAGLDLEEPDEVWERLTLSERNEFQLMAKNGALSTLLCVRHPWWKESDKLVMDMEEGREVEAMGSILPLLPSQLPSLETLVKVRSVSPLLCYNVLNIIYAYAYTVRLHDNGHHELPELASQYFKLGMDFLISRGHCQQIHHLELLLQYKLEGEESDRVKKAKKHWPIYTVMDISTCLSLNQSFETVGEALQAAMATIQQSRELFNSRSFSAAVIADVSCIMRSTKSHVSHVTRSLADLHKLFGKALFKQKPPKSDGNGKTLRLARKKVYFFLAWANLQENIAHCKLLANSVDHEYGNEHASIHIESDNRKESGKPLRMNIVNGKKHVTFTSTEDVPKKLVEEI